MGRYGINIIGELSVEQTLPSSTTETSDNMVYIGGPTGGRLWINVYAHTAIIIASEIAFSIEFKSFSSDSEGSAISPFTFNNRGLVAPNQTGTSEPDAHIYLLHRTSGDNALNFSAGDLMCEFGIPETMCKALGHDWVKLEYVTGASEVSETVDAFVYSKG